MELSEEKRQAIQLYCETGTYLAQHPNLPAHEYDVLLEQANKIRETFTFEELQQYSTERSNRD